MPNNGCREAVEPYLGAIMNYYQTEITYYPCDKETLAEEYFDALEALGTCLARGN